MSRTSSIFVLWIGCASVVCACSDSSDTATSAAATSGTGAAAGSAGAGGTSSNAGGSVPCTLGSNWTVVDDYVHSPGEQSNLAGIAVDTNGNVYAVGLVQENAMYRGLVRISTDGGASWTNADQGMLLPNDASADDDGNVFVIGSLSSERVVRKSSDGGMSWPAVDQVPFGNGNMSPCNTGFIAAGQGGVVYSGGSCDDVGFSMRRSIDGGRSWSDVLSNLLYPQAAATRMQDVGVDASGQGYAAGNGVDPGGKQHWWVVKGTTMGTFTTADDFQLVGGQDAQVYHLTGGDRMLAAGWGSDGMVGQGLLRRSDAGGGAWSTIDTFANEANAAHAASQTMVVVGMALDASMVRRVVTRRSDDGGASWMPLDEYSYVAGKNTSPGQLAADPTGNLYSSIAALDSNDVRHWIVRKLSCE